MSQCGSAVQNIPNKLLSSLFSQKEAGSYCDISMKFGQVELRAHSCVIAAFSPFVNNFLSGKVMVPTDGTCPVLEDSTFNCLDCAKKVIDFMYVGKILITDSHLDHIKAVSEGLQVSELLKICQRHSDKCVQDKLNELNVENSDSVETHTVGAAEGVLNVSCKPPCLDSRESPISSKDPPTELRESGTCLEDDSIAATDDLMDESEWNGMKCPKCGSVYMSLALYQLHCGTHLGKTYTTCYICNYASIRVSDVIKHLQEKSHGEKVCSICLLEVGSPQSLKEHLQVHDQTQPFFCLTCNTRFQTRTALNSHIVRHTSETPYVCKECGRGFKWKHGLRSHMVTHSKLKSLLCDQCGFSTAHLRSFIDHKAAHTGEKFRCPKPDCQFSSVRRDSIKHHLMTHSKERPYQCEVCGQAFSLAKNLRRHALSHNPSASPEKCPLCSYQTNRSDKFKAHFKRYHKDGKKLEDIQGKKKKSSAKSTKSLNKKKVEKPPKKAKSRKLPIHAASTDASFEAQANNQDAVILVNTAVGNKALENSSGSIAIDKLNCPYSVIVSCNSVSNDTANGRTDSNVPVSNGLSNEEYSQLDVVSLNSTHLLEGVIRYSKSNGTVVKTPSSEISSVSSFICDPTLVKQISSGVTTMVQCASLETEEVPKKSGTASQAEMGDAPTVVHSIRSQPASQVQQSVNSEGIQPQGENSENILIKDSDPADDGVVILSPNEVGIVSCLSMSDTVCEIPEGTYVVMDLVRAADSSALTGQDISSNDIAAANYCSGCLDFSNCVVQDSQIVSFS